MKEYEMLAVNILTSTIVAICLQYRLLGAIIFLIIFLYLRSKNLPFLLCLFTGLFGFLVGTFIQDFIPVLGTVQTSIVALFRYKVPLFSFYDRQLSVPLMYIIFISIAIILTIIKWKKTLVVLE